MDDMNLLAYCGLYCGACSFRVAALEQERKHLTAMPAKYDHLKDHPLEECRDCRIDDFCGDCAIKKCARAKNIDHCGECGEFPCDRIVKFSSDGVPHHAKVIDSIRRIREIGSRRWLDESEKAFACRCGKRLSWYVKDCIHE
jgi:hypothetical protein